MPNKKKVTAKKPKILNTTTNTKGVRKAVKAVKPAKTVKAKKSVQSVKITKTAKKITHTVKAAKPKEARKKMTAAPPNKSARLKNAAEVSDKDEQSTKKTGRHATSRDSAASPVGFAPYKEKSGEEYMNEGQVRHFLNILNLWKDQLMSGRDVTVQHMQDEVMNFPDPLDRATLEEEYTLELRARDRERKFIKKIEEALGRIEQGDYGYCENCGAEIGIRRLEARPTATLCIDCKTISEIREKQTGTGMTEVE